MRSIVAMLVLFAGSLFAQDAPKPQISAFFDRIDDGPAFFIECPNTSGEALSSCDERWTEAIRIDGAEPEPEYHMPVGLTTKVAPGEIWKGILALRQMRRTKRSYYPTVKFGAMVRFTRVLTITEGKHTVAVQCGEVWSNDFTFYWDGEANP